MAALVIFSLSLIYNCLNMCLGAFVFLVDVLLWVYLYLFCLDFSLLSFIIFRKIFHLYFFKYLFCSLFSFSAYMVPDILSSVLHHR